MLTNVYKCHQYLFLKILWIDVNKEIINCIECKTSELIPYLVKIKEHIHGGCQQHPEGGPFCIWGGLISKLSRPKTCLQNDIKFEDQSPNLGGVSWRLLPFMGELGGG